MLMPCPTRIVCPTVEFLGEDTPFANLTAERLDSVTFIAIDFGNTQTKPKLGWDYNTGIPPGICVAATLEEAQLCARNNQLNNQYGGYTIPPPPTANPGTPPTSPKVFYNQQESCTYTCPDGLPFVWTIGAGYINAPDQTSADTMAYNKACQLALKNAICVTKFAQNACLNQPYKSSISFRSKNPPLTIDVISGTLPPGLFLSQHPSGDSADLMGTPTVPGNYPFTLRVSDRNANTMTTNQEVDVLGITNITSLPNAMENTAYSFQLNAAGGAGPYTFALTSGTMPGITLSSSGLLSGTPNYVTAGSYPITVRVTDSNGSSCNQTGTLKVNLRPGPDWTKLVWNVQTYKASPPTNQVTAVAAQNILSGTIVAQTPNVDWPTIFGSATLSVPYTGPTVNCLTILTVNYSGTGAGRVQLVCRASSNGSALSAAQWDSSAGNGVFQHGFYVQAGTNVAVTMDDNGTWFATTDQLGAVSNLSFTLAIVNQ